MNNKKYAIRLYTFDNSKKAKPVEEGANLLSPYVENTTDNSIGKQAAHHINEEAYNDASYDRGDTAEDGSWNAYYNNYYIVGKDGEITPAKGTVNKGFSGYSLSDPFHSIYTLNDLLFGEGAGLSVGDFNKHLENSNLMQATPPDLLDAIKRSKSKAYDGTEFYSTDKVFKDSPVTDYFGKYKVLDEDGKGHVNKNKMVVDVSDVKPSDYDKARTIDNFLKTLLVFNPALSNSKKKSYNDLFLVEVPLDSIVKSKDVISSLGKKGALQRDGSYEFTTTRLTPKRRLFAQEVFDRMYSNDNILNEKHALDIEHNPIRKIQMFKDFMKKYYNIDTEYLLSDAQQKYILDDLSNFYDNRQRHINLLKGIKELGQ